MSKRFKRSRNNEKEENVIFTAIKQSNSAVVEKIINTVGLDFSKSWLGGYALLRTAINCNQLKIASWLLTKGCKINRVANNDESDTPLHLAVLQNNYSLVECLLKKGACVTAKNVKGETALHISCQKQNLMITCLLLNDDTAVDIPDNFLTTPLHVAIEKGCLETMKLLLSHKVNINARTIKPGYKGFTALHMAIFNKNNQMVIFLLENGADINAAVGILHLDEILDNDFNVHMNYQSYTPLHLAIEMQNYDIIRSLLNHNADANAIIEHNGVTPLHVAVQKKDEKAVWLLSEYADFCVKTKDGRNILHIALESDWPYLVEVLIHKNANIDEQTNEGETLLFMAVEMGDEDWVEFLLKLNANVNVKNFQHQTPLHIAAEFSEAIVKMLLDSGANVDEIDAHNETPLSTAVKHCNINVVEEILHYNPSIYNNGNKAAFIHATKNINPDYVQIIHILINHGFLVADENIDINLLHYLISHGQFKILEHFLKHGGAIIASMKNQTESSFVHKAVKNGDIEIIQLLILHQFDLNILDTYGKSAIDYAIEIDNDDILDFLLQNGAKIENSPFSLLFSAKNGNIALFEKLLNYRNDVSVSDEFGTTALHIAAWNKDYEFVQILLNEGACINTTDNCSDQIVTKTIETDSYSKELKKQIFTSPLHIAVAKKDKDVCTMFLECHANVNSKDGFGRTPLHIAAAMKSSDQNTITKILFNYGANVNVLDDFKRLPIYYLYNHSCICSIAFQNQYDLYSECECDLYDENEVNCVITTFVKYIVLLTSMNKKVCIENYKIIKKNEFSADLQIACFNEISKMRGTKLYDHISFYDVLNKKYNSLAALARNDDLIQAFETTKYTEKFPLYCDTIRDKFNRAKNRNHLLQRALFSFNNLTDFTLPQPVVENIFDFLLSNDLKMIIAAYN